MGPVQFRTIPKVMDWKMGQKCSIKTMTTTTWRRGGSTTSSSIRSMRLMQSSMWTKTGTPTNVKRNGTPIHVNRRVSPVKVNTVTTSNEVFHRESAL